MTKLTQLLIMDNNIKIISGLDTLVNLYSLNLSGNKISVISGLDKLENLQILNLSENKIKKLSPNCWQLRSLPSLINLDLENNQIDDADKVMPYFENFK